MKVLFPKSKLRQRFFCAFIILVMYCSCVRRGWFIVKVTDTTNGSPVSNAELRFADSPELDPLIRPDPPVNVMLDSKGEARLRLRYRRGWISILVAGINYGTSLETFNLRRGGSFRLYGPPPSINDTKVYPSKYLLEIQKQ